VEIKGSASLLLWIDVQITQTTTVREAKTQSLWWGGSSFLCQQMADWPRFNADNEVDVKSL